MAISEWWHKPLEQLDKQEWEALCDGCAKCCLHKLQDEEDDKIYYTKVRCRYLNEDSCRCSDYENRSILMPNCIALSQKNMQELDWLPQTCAYRLRSQGERLPSWHPLVSGDATSVHNAGISISGRSISDEYVHPDGYEEHIVHWVE